MRTVGMTKPVKAKKPAVKPESSNKKQPKPPKV